TAILNFPVGRYDLYPDSAAKKEYFISNTSTEQECPSKIKTIGILLSGMKNITIEGNGSLLVFHGKMTMFAAERCENILIQNLSFDFERPTMSEFTIIKSSPAAIEIKVHPDSWYKLDSGRLTWYGEGWTIQHSHCIRLDTVAGTMYYANENYSRLIKSTVKEIAPFHLRFEGNFDTADFPNGNVFTIRDPIRDQ